MECCKLTHIPFFPRLLANTRIYIKGFIQFSHSPQSTLNLSLLSLPLFLSSDISRPLSISSTQPMFLTCNKETTMDARVSSRSFFPYFSLSPFYQIIVRLDISPNSLIFSFFSLFTLYPPASLILFRFFPHYSTVYGMYFHIPSNQRICQFPFYFSLTLFTTSLCLVSENSSLLYQMLSYHLSVLSCVWPNVYNSRSLHQPLSVLRAYSPTPNREGNRYVNGIK